MSLFSILVDIAANTAKFTSAIERTEAQLTHFGEQAREVGERVKGALEFAGVAAGVGELIHQFDEFIEHAAHLEQTSQKVGVTVEQLSGLEFAAKKAGVSSEQLATGMEKFAKSVEAATAGTGKQAAAFAAMGISLTDSSGHLKSMDDLMLQVADKFAGYKDSVEKTALAQILFGKSGAELIPLLNEGREGIEAYTERLKELGAVIDEKTAKAAEEFHHKLQDLSAVGQALWSTVAAQLLPSLTTLTDRLIKGAAGANKFQEEIQPLVTGLKLLVDAGYSVYRTFMDVGTALGALSAAAVQFATGNFRQAVETYKDHLRDLLKNQEEGNAFLKKLWSDTGDVITTVADKVEKEGEKTTAPLVSALENVKTLAEQVSDVLDEIDKRSHGEFGAKSFDLGEKASAEAIRELEKLDKQFIKSREADEKMISELQRLADQAALSMQHSFANFLFDPFHKGLKGMLADFVDIIRRMVAEALASNIFKALFGMGDDSSGGGSGLGGLLGGFLGVAMTGIGGLFGGGAAAGALGATSGVGELAGGGIGFAAGGADAAAGQPFVIGERGPELFVPDTAGTIMPNSVFGRMGSAPTFNHTYNIDARGADAERIMQVLPVLMAQVRAATKRDILSAFERSGYGAPRTA